MPISLSVWHQKFHCKLLPKQMATVACIQGPSHSIQGHIRKTWTQNCVLHFKTQNLGLTRGPRPWVYKPQCVWLTSLGQVANLTSVHGQSGLWPKRLYPLMQFPSTNTLHAFRKIQTTSKAAHIGSITTQNISHKFEHIKSLSVLNWCTVPSAGLFHQLFLHNHLDIHKCLKILHLVHVRS